MAKSQKSKCYMKRSNLLYTGDNSDMRKIN